MDTYVRWIKARSWYHRSVLKREQLNLCPHLQNAPQLPPNVKRPSEATLPSYKNAYEKLLRTKKQVIKNQQIFRVTLRLHGMTAEANEIDKPCQTSATSASTPAPTPSRSQQTVPMEVNRSGPPSTSGSHSTGAHCSPP